MTPAVTQAVEAADNPISTAVKLALYYELWVSLASMLRSYAGVHGLHLKKQADVTASANHIAVRCEEKRLSLYREDANVLWTRENGSSGRMEITEVGRLRSNASEEELDLAAEAWIRELMG